MYQNWKYHISDFSKQIIISKIVGQKKWHIIATTQLLSSSTVAKILNHFYSGWLPARLMVAKDGGSAGDGNSLLQVFAQIHPDSSFEKNWPWVKFWKPPDFNQDQFGHFKQNLPWVKVWNHLWNPWPLSAPSSHSYSNILIDIACAVPIALLLSHSYSHSHSSFQVHFLIQYFLLVLPNF